MNVDRMESKLGSRVHTRLYDRHTVRVATEEINMVNGEFNVICKQEQSGSIYTEERVHLTIKIK